MRSRIRLDIGESFNGFKRIREDTAERTHDEGGEVYILPCKLVPDDGWNAPRLVECEDGMTFMDFVLKYQESNCDPYRGVTLYYYTKE